MTKKSKQSLTIFAFGFLFSLIFAWVFYQRRQGIARANKLIAEFHRHYNSDKFDPGLEYSPMIRDTVADTRDRLGKFSNVKHCDVRRSTEPRSLDVRCLSTFQGGEGVEFFMFQGEAGEKGLLVYLAKSNEQKTPPVRKNWR